MRMSNREILADLGYDETIVFDSPDYDSALIGVTVNGQAVYDFDAMCQHHMDTDGMTAEEAEEFIWFNAIGSLPSLGDSAPIVVILLGRDESG